MGALQIKKGRAMELLKIYPAAKGVLGAMVIIIAHTRHVETVVKMERL